MSANEDTPLCGENVTEEQLGNSGSEIVDIGSTDAELNVEIPTQTVTAVSTSRPNALTGNRPTYTSTHAWAV